MNTLQATSKRQHENDESQQRKMQRTESPAELVQPMKIIDLNDDCLLKTFGKLDLQSLFNVSIANEWLRPAAREVYKSKFGTKLVKISPIPGRFELKEDDIDISIRGLKTCLQYLRCFGPSISDLSIEYKYSKTKRYAYVHQYVEQYCAENLKVVRIDYSTGFGKASLLKKVIADLVHEDRQLKSLKISDRLDNPKDTQMDTWLDITKDEASIIELCIDTPNTEMNSAHMQRLANEHPALIELSLPCCYLTYNDVNAVIRRLKSLKTFEIILLNAQYDHCETQLDRGWSKVVGSYSCRRKCVKLMRNPEILELPSVQL